MNDLDFRLPVTSPVRHDWHLLIVNRLDFRAPDGIAVPVVEPSKAEGRDFVFTDFQGADDQDREYEFNVGHPQACDELPYDTRCGVDYWIEAVGPCDAGLPTTPGRYRIRYFEHADPDPSFGGTDAGLTVEKLTTGDAGPEVTG